MSAPAEDPIVRSLEPVSERENRPAIALRNLVLCVECDAAYEAHGKGCPICGSLSRFPLARVVRPMRTET